MSKRAKYRKNNNISFICSNRLDTCQRAACECDLKLADALHQKIINQVENYNIDNHLFYGQFDRRLKCEKKFSDGKADACCVSASGYGTAYHSVRQECCDDGSVNSIGLCAI